MKTLLEKKKDIRNVGIIILLVISSLSIVLLCITFFLSRFNNTVEKFRVSETRIFYSITNGQDTCLVMDCLSWAYDALNIKVLDQNTFDTYFMKKVFNDDVIEVSEKYYKEEEPYRVTPVDAISNIYNKYGLDSLLNYLDEYPITRLHNFDMASFKWATYILWQNDIYVSSDTESVYYYIDYDLTREQ